MATKTAVHVSSAELAKAEYRRDAATDRRLYVQEPDYRAQMRQRLAQWREDRNRLQPSDLLKLAQAAARLELRGAAYGADDRLDVAGRIVTAVMMETGGSMPLKDAPRVKLGRLCGDAKNYRRALDSLREADAADAEHQRQREALGADALAPDGGTIDDAVAVVGKREVSPEDAAEVADQMARRLRLDVTRVDAAWIPLYTFARGQKTEQCAADLELTPGAYRVRSTRGAKTVRESVGSASVLLMRLRDGAGFGAVAGRNIGTGDATREAGSRTRMLADVASAPHWRERTDTYPSPVASRKDASVRLHHMTVKARRGDAEAQLAARADSLRGLGAALAASGTRRRPKASSPTSDLRRALDQKTYGRR